MVARSTVENPLEGYGPPPESDAPPGSAGPDRFPWLQWLQLGLTCALLVLFANQVLAFRDVNRKIARLHERIDLLENSRMLDATPALEAQQRTLQQRLRQLEAALRELGNESQPPASAEKEIPAFQLPPPPRLLP
jgi:hypothetical protein